MAWRAMAYPDRPRMTEGKDDLVRIDVSGVAHPVGETARVRLQGRSGMFHVLLAPPQLVVMRQAAPEGGVGPRACLLSGEVHAPGALCEIASFLGQSPGKGELVVLDRGSSRSVYFDSGYVVGAKSSVASERLGEVMYRLGVLDEQQLAACQQAAASNHLRLGEAAVELGLVVRERVFELMAVQTQEIFHATLLVGSGAFYFLESFDESELAAPHRLSIAALVRDGVRRMHETRFFRARIPSPFHVPVATSQARPSDPELQPVYASMDGVRSIADIGRALAMGEFEVTRAVFQLVQAGAASIRPPRLGPKAMVDVYNGAMAMLLRELDAVDEGDAVRLQLASRATSTPRAAQVFVGADPSDDWTFDAVRVAENVARLPDADAVEDALGRWLHEHASYALFLARPHLLRAQARASGDGSAPRVSQVVGSMLEPIAPHEGLARTKEV
jgi:hypothetical protein